jgi:hypothetical protein
MLLLLLGPDRVSKHLPRRTRLRRPAGLEENRSVPPNCFVQGTSLFYTTPGQLSIFFRGPLGHEFFGKTPLRACIMMSINIALNFF